MNDLLVCSSDPLFIKNLYGVLRQLGFGVNMTDHAAHAVQMSFGREYAAVLPTLQAVIGSSGS